MKTGLDKEFILTCLDRDGMIENAEFKFGGIVNLGNRNATSIQFRNCTFNDKLLFKSSEKLNDIHFINCTFYHQTIFEEFKEIQVIAFNDCTFKSDLKFDSIEDIMCSIYMEDCKLDSNRVNEYENLKISRLGLTNCDVSKLKVKNSEVYDLYLENCGVKYSLDFINLKSELTSIKNENKKKSIGLIRINSDECEEFEIDSITSVSDLKLFGFNKAEINCACDKFRLYTGDFDLLAIGVTTLDDSIKNSRIGVFNAGNLNQTGTIRIDKVCFSKFELEDVDASKATYFVSETVFMDTSIEGCVFDKFYCNQLFFINDPEILRSDVSSFVINNLGWSKEKKLKDSDDFNEIPWFYLWRKKKLAQKEKGFDKDDIVQLRYQKDTYRQFKMASFANKNTIDGLQFHANEMQAYWKEVRITGGISITDRILIFINRWSSNFGQSWFLPLLWIFFGQLLFCLLIWNFQANKWCGEGTHCSLDFVSGLSQYLTWLIPIYKSPEHWTDGSKIIGVLMRVYNGFFIYHFIKASRKFGRV